MSELENKTEPTGTPRWVKILAMVALLAIVLVVVLIVTGKGGEHGPGRHMLGGANSAVAVALGVMRA
jgi:hypothetical protein